MAGGAEREQGIERFFDLSKMTQGHQTAFNKLYRLSFLHVEENSQEPNPLLFTKVEGILNPVFAAWKEKYDSIKKLTDVRRIWKDGPPAKLTLDDNKSATLERSDIYDGEFPVQPLIIHCHPAYASALPILIESYSHYWREKHELEVCFFNGKFAKRIAFVIDEVAGSKTGANSLLNVDSLYINGEETTGCMKKGIINSKVEGPKRSFILSVRKLPADIQPHPHRIPDPSFHNTWD